LGNSHPFRFPVVQVYRSRGVTLSTFIRPDMKKKDSRGCRVHHLAGGPYSDRHSQVSFAMRRLTQQQTRNTGPTCRAHRGLCSLNVLRGGHKDLLRRHRTILSLRSFLGGPLGWPRCRLQSRPECRPARRLRRLQTCQLVQVEVHPGSWGPSSQVPALFSGSGATKTPLVLALEGQQPPTRRGRGQSTRSDDARPRADAFSRSAPRADSAELGRVGRNWQ